MRVLLSQCVNPLIYALHIDSDFDVEQIYRSLTSNPELQKTTMSVAEKLLAKGR